MSSSSSSTATARRTNAALVVAAALAALANALWLYADLRHDDAFITFQYARHLGSGDGFVFNHGERVLGTSSPGFALLLAVVYRIFGDVLPHAAILIGSLALSAQALLVERLLRPAGRGLAMTVALLLLCGFAGGQPWLALETNLCTALMLGAVVAFEGKRAATCGALLGLAFLIRNDVVLLVPLLAVGWWLRHRTIPWRLLVTALVVVLPWLVAATLYFGSFLPHTLAAKQAVTPVGEYLAHYVEHIAMAPWRTAYGGMPASTLVMGFATLLAAIGVGRLRREARGLLWPCAFGVLLLATYARIGPPATQHWHMYPVVLMFRVVCVVGVFTVIEHLVTKRFGGDRGRAAAMIAMVALAAIVVSRAPRTARATVSSHWYGERHERYGEVVAWLGSRIDRGKTLMASEVGTLGYLSDRKLIDACGLINESNAYHRDPSLENLAELVARYQPDVLLVNSRQRGETLEQTTAYRIIKVFPSDPWSTILIRSPDVLVEPASFDELRREVAAGKPAPR